MRYTQVSDSLAAHKADLKQFWRRVRATKGKFWLLVVAGESECVPSDPTATSPLVVKALCRADQFKASSYIVQSVKQLTRAVDSPPAGIITILLRENHSEDDLDEFFKIEKPEDICSMTHVLIKDGRALAAGRVAILHVIAADKSGKPDFSKVFSCKREGEHAVVETRPLETLFAEAVNESSSPIVMELRRRVGAIQGAELAAFEASLAERDAFACEIEDRLEEARVSGKEHQIVLVAYQPKFSIGGGRGASTDFVVNETRLRTFENFNDMVRKAADEGLRLLDFRVGSDGRAMVRVCGGSTPGETIKGGLAELLPPADKGLAESIVVLMPDGTAFPETPDKFPDEIREAVKRGRLFVAEALDLFAAKPELLNDLLDPQLDCCRPWVPASEEERNMLRKLGNDPLYGGTRQKHVVFNAEAKKSDGTHRFRTFAAVAAELAEARAKQKAEPAVALTGTERTLSTKLPDLDLEALLIVDPDGERLLNVEGAKSLLVKWTGQLKLYDADNNYTVKWGGHSIPVTRDFKDIFKCGYNYPNAPKEGKGRPKLTGGPLMRYYIEVLEDAIKDATEEDSV